MSHKPDPGKNVNLTIDGKPVTVPEGTRILEAAKTVNINIPVLCEHPDLCKRALCRICVVECDGRGKLVAACANDVWEGVNIVTINKRLVSIRKTIIEMILANHPNDCLKCVRNKNCELQTLAANYGIVSSSFENEAEETPPVIAGDTIVHDTKKCIKCGRCVEACQEVQTIRAINTAFRSHEFDICTAYNQPLKDVSCVFCGYCASVCPVGSIYEHDQSAEVQAAIRGENTKAIAQFSPALLQALERELAITAGSVTKGKLTAALKLIGFDRVYDTEVAANTVNAKIINEIDMRKKANEQTIPLISGCSEGVSRFINIFFPDLKDHLGGIKTARKQFAMFKKDYAINAGVNPQEVISVSFVSCLAQKYAEDQDKTDFALTVTELARIIKRSGIMIETIAEEPFDSLSCGLPKQDFTGEKITVNGYGQARKLMESIQNGEFTSGDWIEISSCPKGSCS